MGVGTAKPEGVHAGAPGRVARRPGAELGGDSERTLGQRDLGIHAVEVEARHDGPMPQHEDRLEQPRHARGRLQVAEIALHRAHGAEARARGALAEGARQRRHLDGIAHGRGAAMGLDIADGLGIDRRHLLRLGDHRGLPVLAGRGEAELAAAVIVHRGAEDQGMDRVTIGERPVVALEDDPAEPVAEHGAAGFGRDSRISAAISARSPWPGPCRTRC